MDKLRPGSAWQGIAGSCFGSRRQRLGLESGVNYGRRRGSRGKHRAPRCQPEGQQQHDSEQGVVEGPGIRSTTAAFLRMHERPALRADPADVAGQVIPANATGSLPNPWAPDHQNHPAAGEKQRSRDQKRTQEPGRGGQGPTVDPEPRLSGRSPQLRGHVAGAPVHRANMKMPRSGGKGGLRHTSVRIVPPQDPVVRGWIFPAGLRSRGHAKAGPI